MRARIIGESATTEQLRDVALALAAIGRPGELLVGVCGAKWSFQTPTLSGTQLVAMLGNPSVAMAQGEGS